MTEPRSRLVAGVVIVLVFVAGVAVGFFVRHEVGWHDGTHGLAVDGPAPRSSAAVKASMLARLDRELKLTPAQHTRIDSVLSRREADLHTLMSETRPRFDSIAHRTRADIQAVLTPQQRDEFAKIVQEIDRRRQAREANR